VRRTRFLTIAAICAAIAGCGGGGDDAAKRSPAAKATPTPAPLMFASHRYISPCAVLPRVGPYAFMLRVTRHSGLELYSGKDVDVAGYRKLADAIATDMRARMRK
jgi:hypothetical protein